VEPAAVLTGEVLMGKQVLGGILQELGHLGELRTEHPGDLVELVMAEAWSG
jgi:hypothetical protein